MKKIIFILLIIAILVILFYPKNSGGVLCGPDCPPTCLNSYEKSCFGIKVRDSFADGFEDLCFGIIYGSEQCYGRRHGTKAPKDELLPCNYPPFEQETGLSNEVDDIDNNVDDNIIDFTIKDIKDVFYFSDGGTTGFITEKENGEEFKFCFDGRMFVGSDPPPPRHFFINATHPTSEGAERLDTDSPEEIALIASLDNWLVTNYPAGELFRLLEIDTVVGLTEEELKPYRILNIVGLPLMTQ